MNPQQPICATRSPQIACTATSPERDTNPVEQTEGQDAATWISLAIQNAIQSLYTEPMPRCALQEYADCGRVTYEALHDSIQDKYPVARKWRYAVREMPFPYVTRLLPLIVENCRDQKRWNTTTNSPRIVPDDMKKNDLLTPVELSRMLKVDVVTVEQMVNAGQIEYVDIDGTIRFRRDQLHDLTLTRRPSKNDRAFCPLRYRQRTGAG